MVMHRSYKPYSRLEGYIGSNPIGITIFMKGMIMANSEYLSSTSFEDYFRIMFLPEPYQKNSIGYRMSEFDRLDKEWRSLMNEYPSDYFIQIMEFFNDNVPSDINIVRQMCEDIREEQQV